MQNFRLFLFSTLAGLASTTTLFAQYLVKPTFFETTGVSCQGMVSGYEVQSGPYLLWNPADNSITTIGGTAPGNGVGGRAQFSENGNYISGCDLTEIPVNTDWQRYVLEDYDYIFMSMEFPEGKNEFGYAAGESLTYNGNGIVLRTTDGGLKWQSMWIDTENRGLEAISFPSISTGYVGGWNLYFAKTINAGWDWEVMNPGAGQDVYVYTSMDFKDENNGVVGAQLNNGVTVFVTSDGGASWTQGTGIAGVPMCVKHVSGDTYILTTVTGKIQKSTDNGLTWNTVYSMNGALILGVNFYDEMTGIAVGETYIYKTVNGGNSWVQVSVSPNAEGILWRDVAWIDQDHLILAGTPDIIFQSDNGGQSWYWANEQISNLSTALYDISITDNTIHVCGSQGNFYKKSRISSMSVAEMARYDVNSQTWTTLGNLGFVVDNSTSSGYAISGDGNILVGNSWADPANGNGTTPYTHAVAWNEEDGIIDLGSLYAVLNRSTRADALSHDGSIIAGWQDFNGPWKSAVWRKNPAGGYFPNEYLLIDPQGNPYDEFNQLGQASAVSANGNWIGGYGDYAFANPWLWSEATGLLDLGNMGLPEGTTGYVSGINSDGTRVIGWYDYSPDPWTHEYTPFIWTPATGSMNLNTFITDTLGYTMEKGPVYIPNCMSADGKFIAGWGLDPEPAPWGELFTFRLEIPTNWVNIKENPPESNIRIFPNPATDHIKVISPTFVNRVEIFNSTGQLIKNEKISSRYCSLDLTGLPHGLYLVKTISENVAKSFQLIKK